MNDFWSVANLDSPQLNQFKTVLNQFVTLGELLSIELYWIIFHESFWNVSRSRIHWFNQHYIHLIFRMHSISKPLFCGRQNTFPAKQPIFVLIIKIQFLSFLSFQAEFFFFQIQVVFLHQSTKITDVNSGKSHKHFNQLNTSLNISNIPSSITVKRQR